MHDLKNLTYKLLLSRVVLTKRCIVLPQIISAETPECPSAVLSKAPVAKHCGNSSASHQAPRFAAASLYALTSACVKARLTAIALKAVSTA